jgi:hypothetical protein
MREKQASDRRSGIVSVRGFRPGLIARAVVLGLVLVCVVGCGALTTPGGPAADDAGRGSRAFETLPTMSEGVAVEMPPEQPIAESVANDESHLAYAAERLIIRTGNISMVVEDTRATQRTIEDMVAGMASDGAFVVSSDEYGGTEGIQPQVTMSIRVPAAHFDRVMDRLAGLAEQVNSRNESAQDVTEEYVDLEARLESLETARQRLLQIMEEARSTKDLLEAEQQLTQREAEIESIKGRMQYLEESAQLSSIWIDLQPYLLSQPVAEQWRPAETARRAVEALVGGLQGFGDFLIFFTIAILPWLLALGAVLVVIVLLVRWRSRARRARQSAAAAADEGTAAE